jgi:hypothetical protein
MSENRPTAMALLQGWAAACSGRLTETYIFIGQRFYGHWMQDGRFYFPMTQPSGKIVICSGGPHEFGPIIED